MYVARREPADRLRLAVEAQASACRILARIIEVDIRDKDRFDKHVRRLAAAWADELLLIADALVAAAAAYDKTTISRWSDLARRYALPVAAAGTVVTGVGQAAGQDIYNFAFGDNRPALETAQDVLACSVDVRVELTEGRSLSLGETGARVPSPFEELTEARRNLMQQRSAVVAAMLEATGLTTEEFTTFVNTVAPHKVSESRAQEWMLHMVLTSDWEWMEAEWGTGLQQMPKALSRWKADQDRQSGA